MSLTDEEKRRYQRHITLDGFGEKGQMQLHNASVLIVGAGGLGCPVLLYLSAAGIGRIGIVDGDVVELSNLQRQVLYTEADLNRNKATAAQERIKAMNSGLQVEAEANHLDTSNALRLIERYDLVVDCTDNIATRYLINDVCVMLNKVMVYGAIFKYSGQVSIFNCQSGPTYRCLFPDLLTAAAVPDCSETGVLGVLPGITGMLQAQEVIKVITGVGSPLAGQLLTFDGLKNSYDKFEFERNETSWGDIPRTAEEIQAYDYELRCGVGSVSGERLMEMLEQDPEAAVVDIREPHEQPSILSGRSKKIPLGELSQRADELKDASSIVLFCQSGVRSAKAVKQLKERYPSKEIVDLHGGVKSFVKIENND